MLSTVYHNKACVLKIPLDPPLPKGDQGLYPYVHEVLPTHLNDEPDFISYCLPSSLPLLSLCVRGEDYTALHPG